MATRFAGATRTYSYGYSSGFTPDSLLLATTGTDSGYTLIGGKDRKCFLYSCGVTSFNF
ncbi:hypothetical protein M096_4273 [Parabacteroides distasonis str. 3999B T(B) 6]|nr:hypothetical protein M095_4646 [Parabacteroides distasonis str. 3999B T(B) 4]KDS66777.1 hypothetical protein M096_4273 [Parabacteroides distasonis str. 3999B T(B) 6]